MAHSCNTPMIWRWSHWVEGETWTCPTCGAVWKLISGKWVLQ